MNASGTPTGKGRSLSQSSDGYRDKTAISACERCRRRKIRCDNETPCKTCRRFRLICTRPQKNDTQGLEQRVRQLEDQIAQFTSVSNSQSHGPGSISIPQPWTDAGISPDFGWPGPAEQHQFPYDNMSPLDIPTIQVDDYASTISPVSPISPVSLSPSQALPPSAMPYLSPRSLPAASRSRSSSMSSIGQADWASAPGDIGYGNQGDLSPSAFSSFPPPDETPVPARVEAENLINGFFQCTENRKFNGTSYPLDRNRLFGLLDFVEGQTPSNCDGTSMSMARFHVYMVMAIGARLDEREGNARELLRGCYHLAMKETRAPSFWKQDLGTEAATLLAIFAQASRQT